VATVNAVRAEDIVGIWISPLRSLRLRNARSGKANSGGTQLEERIMRREELMKADLLSEIVLLGSGVAIVIAFLIVVAAALTSAAAMQ
jgi:hypothetical protein